MVILHRRFKLCDKYIVWVAEFYSLHEWQSSIVYIEGLSYVINTLYEWQSSIVYIENKV